MNRRQLAGASGAALLVGLAGPGKASELDGDLLERVEALVAHLTEKRAVLAAMTEDERREASAREYAQPFRRNLPEDVMAAAIARIPARTPEGAKAKARALVWQQGGDDTAQAGWALGDGLFESLLMDLTGATCVLRPFPQAGVPVPALPHIDAEVIAASAQHIANFHATALVADDNAPEWDAYYETLDAVSNARPATLTGMAAKARAAVLEATDPDGTVDMLGVGGG